MKSEIPNSVGNGRHYEIAGLKVPFYADVISLKILRHIENGQYERGEIIAASEIVSAGDVVLDLGAGLGLVGSAAAKLAGARRVVSIEANPKLIPIIQETAELNEVDNLDVKMGSVTADGGEPQNFYLRKDFWASSLSQRPSRHVETIKTPNLKFQSLIDEVDPDIIIMDIEGGEENLFNDVDLRKVEKILIEFHEKEYGAEGRNRITDLIIEKGFQIVKQYTKGSVATFSRTISKPADPKAVSEKRFDPQHTISDPDVAIITCMKNEGPFILEWIAYHRSIGIEKFVVFTNHCTDGTDLLLDRLDELGLVTHLENPAVEFKSTYFQPSALKYGARLPIIRRADYAISMDVDEFINIRVGEGHFRDLLAAAGPFHALAMSQLNFSHGGHFEYSDIWLTENFLDHESTVPGRRRAHRGVKTIVHPVGAFDRLSNHRPILGTASTDDLIWLDGAGRDVKSVFLDQTVKGFDCRGNYELVALNHYPIRSVHSYLVKKDRGDVVVAKKTVDEAYFKRYSRGGMSENWILPKIAKAREEYSRLMEDKTLAELHEFCITQHKKRYREIEAEPDVTSLRDWIADHYYAPAEMGEPE